MTITIQWTLKACMMHQQGGRAKHTQGNAAYILQHQQHRLSTNVSAARLDPMPERNNNTANQKSIERDTHGAAKQYADITSSSIMWREQRSVQCGAEDSKALAGKGTNMKKHKPWLQIPGGAQREGNDFPTLPQVRMNGTNGGSNWRANKSGCKSASANTRRHWLTDFAAYQASQPSIAGHKDGDSRDCGENGKSLGFAKMKANVLDSWVNSGRRQKQLGEMPHGELRNDWESCPGVCKPGSHRTGAANPPPIISLLMKANLLMLGDKVEYKCESNKVLAVGWVTWSGILCSRCATVVGLSGFRRCAGDPDGRPVDHIYVSSGYTLHSLAMRLGPDLLLEMNKYTMVSPPLPSNVGLNEGNFKDQNSSVQDANAQSI